MSKTKTENLNKIFIEFANDILSVYPKYADKINKQIDRVKDNMETKYYLEYYLRHVFPNIEDISVCNQKECSKSTNKHNTTSFLILVQITLILMFLLALILLMTI